VYLVSTAAGVLYTGISTDPERRLQEHGTGTRGSRALRGKGPLQLVFRKEAGTRSAASKLEARIKKLSRAQKLQLICGTLDWAEFAGGEEPAAVCVPLPAQA
jgi:putative endonuclease